MTYVAHSLASAVVVAVVRVVCRLGRLAELFLDLILVQVASKLYLVKLRLEVLPDLWVDVWHQSSTAVLVPTTSLRVQ